MSLTAQVQILDQDTRAISANRGGEAYGQRAYTSDGRGYIYGLAGAVNLAPGKMTQGAVSATNNVNRTGVTAVAGAQTITFTLGGTATADSFAGGYLVVNAGTGAGQACLIAGNTAATAGNSNSVTLFLAEGLFVATAAADSKFSVHPSIYSAILISASASSTTAIPVGVPAVTVTAANYAWFQTTGMCSVLANGTPALASGVIVGATTDGSVDVEGASAVTARVGLMAVAAVSTEYRPVILTIL